MPKSNDVTETASRVYDGFRYSIAAGSVNPRLGHNFSRVAVFSATRATQPKHRISEPNDVYEQGADRVADRVMRCGMQSWEKTERC